MNGRKLREVFLLGLSVPTCLIMQTESLRVRVKRALTLQIGNGPSSQIGSG